MELLGLRDCVCSAFQDNVKPLSNSMVSVYIPMNSGWSFLWLCGFTFFPALVLCRNGWKMVSHFGLNFIYLSNDHWVFIFPLPFLFIWRVIMPMIIIMYWVLSCVCRSLHTPPSPRQPDEVVNYHLWGPGEIIIRVYVTNCIFPNDSLHIFITCDLRPKTNL